MAMDLSWEVAPIGTSLPPQPPPRPSWDLQGAELRACRPIRFGEDPRLQSVLSTCHQDCTNLCKPWHGFPCLRLICAGQLCGGFAPLLLLD